MKFNSTRSCFRNALNVVWHRRNWIGRVLFVPLWALAFIAIAVAVFTDTIEWLEEVTTKK